LNGIRFKILDDAVDFLEPTALALMEAASFCGGAQRSRKRYSGQPGLKGDAQIKTIKRLRFIKSKKQKIRSKDRI